MTIQDLKAFMEVVRDGQSNESKSQRQPSIPVSSVDKKWKVNLQSLLKFLQVTKTTALAPIWFALGDGTKKEERIILQAALDDFSLSPSAATNAKLVVDKSLCNTVVNLMMFSGDSDRLDEGLHPFRTVYDSVAKSSAALSHLQTYDLLATEGTLHLEDIRLFQHVF
jgi:hypothetical protein